jgi:hypothetical protein
MLELFTKKPVFQGNDEIHQLDVIYRILGTPSPDRWSGLTELPWYELVKPKEVIHDHFRDLFNRYVHRTTFMRHLTTYFIPGGCHPRPLTLLSDFLHTTPRRESLQSRLSKLPTSRKNNLHLSCL